MTELPFHATSVDELTPLGRKIMALHQDFTFEDVARLDLEIREALADAEKKVTDLLLPGVRRAQNEREEARKERDKAIRERIEAEREVASLTERVRMWRENVDELRKTVEGYQQEAFDGNRRWQTSWQLDLIRQRTEKVNAANRLLEEVVDECEDHLPLELLETVRKHLKKP